MYENAFIYKISDNEMPVRFGFSKEERDWLKQERTMDEIIDFIDEKGLALPVSTAMHNNDIGFAIAPLIGNIVKENGKTWFVAEPMHKYGKPEMIELDEPDEEMEDVEENAYNKQYYVYSTIEDGEEVLSLFWVGDNEETENPENCSIENIYEIFRIFLEYAEVDTYHKLGKVINKGQKIYNQYIENENFFMPEYVSESRKNKVLEEISIITKQLDKANCF